MLYSTVYVTYLQFQKNTLVIVLVEEEPSQEEHDTKNYEKGFEYYLSYTTKNHDFDIDESIDKSDHCYFLAHKESEGNRRLVDYPPEV